MVEWPVPSHVGFLFPRFTVFRFCSFHDLIDRETGAPLKSRTFNPNLINCLRERFSVNLDLSHPLPGFPLPECIAKG
jgi:hypothetical protein